MYLVLFSFFIFFNVALYRYQVKLVDVNSLPILINLDKNKIKRLSVYQQHPYVLLKRKMAAMLFVNARETSWYAKNNLFDIVFYSPWGRGGAIIGMIYAYIHPMKNLEGYWEGNYLLRTDSGNYHIFSRVNIINRSIQSSMDVYDDRDQVKARCNTLFNIRSANNVFCVKCCLFPC